MVNDYRIFISHSWTYGDAYDRLTSMLKERSYFSYTDYSVPKSDPIHSCGTDALLYQAIKNKIQLCNIVLIMAGKYASYSKWIDKEVQISKGDFNKPLLGICPWGSQQVSSLVKANADELVGWNTESIVSAIRRWVI